jgi:hypothetical protein
MKYENVVNLVRVILVSPIKRTPRQLIGSLIDTTVM